MRTPDAITAGWAKGISGILRRIFEEIRTAMSSLTERKPFHAVWASMISQRLVGVMSNSARGMFFRILARVSSKILNEKTRRRTDAIPDIKKIGNGRVY